MKSFEAGFVINATPDRIWAILVDGMHYPDWDSGVLSVDGRIAAGDTIKVVSSASPGRTFPVKVTEFDPNRSMTWAGGMPLGLSFAQFANGLKRRAEQPS
jgi:uncharacterized protein YndB with AHSA1/START domain